MNNDIFVANTNMNTIIRVLNIKIPSPIAVIYFSVEKRCIEFHYDYF